MAADDEGLTAEEADLFDDLVDRIGSNKTRVLDVLEGAEGGAGASGTDAPADDASPVPSEDRSADIGPAADADPGTGDSGGVSPRTLWAERGWAETVRAETIRRSTRRTEPMGTTHRIRRPTGRISQRPAPIRMPASIRNRRNPLPVRGSACKADDVDRTTVRITSDIGDILGVDDREYTLSSDDVVTLPEQNAAPSSIGRRPSASSERASSPIVINGFVSTTRCSRTAV